MKFLLTVAAVVAVAVAVPTHRELVAPSAADFAPIFVDQSPNAVEPAIIDSYEPIAVGPAVIDTFEPISVGPAIVEPQEPISVGPAIVDFPHPEGNEVAPAPVAVMPIPVGEVSLLLKIMLSVSQVTDSNVVAPAPITIIPEPVAIAPAPVVVAPTPVDVAPTPVVVPPTPVDVAPTPVAVVPAPVAVAPTPVAAAPLPISAYDDYQPEPAIVVDEAPFHFEPVHVVESPNAVNIPPNGMPVEVDTPVVVFNSA